MDILSAYWRYHTPIGGYPTPSSPLNGIASPYGRERYDYPPAGQRGLYRPDYRGPSQWQGVSLHAHRL